MTLGVVARHCWRGPGGVKGGRVEMAVTESGSWGMALERVMSREARMRSVERTEESILRING